MSLKHVSSSVPQPYIIFTDGASSGNPGPGGWAYISVSPDHQVEEKGGYEAHTTNNAMELKAPLHALESLAHLALSTPIEIYTDSTYVILGITQWIHAWRKRSWLTLEGTPIANLELWQKLQALTLKRNLQWKYVKGHSGVPGNERADQIAVAYSQRSPLPLFYGKLEEYRIPILHLPPQTEVPTRPFNSKDKRSTPASVNYLSLVNGTLRRHTSWKDCESCVKGRSGAKFKKITNQEEEKKVLLAWGFNPLQPPYQNS